MLNSRVNSRANPPATSATEVEVLFASLAPTGPEFSQKKMFGYLCCFVNGNLFAGLHKRNMIFRLPAGDQAVFLQIEGAAPFKPRPGRSMQAYVSLADPLSQDPRLLKKWMSRALAHVSAMPRKAKKAAKAGARTGKR